MNLSNIKVDITAEGVRKRNEEREQRESKSQFQRVLNAIVNNKGSNKITFFEYLGDSVRDELQRRGFTVSALQDDPREGRNHTISW